MSHALYHTFSLSVGRRYEYNGCGYVIWQRAGILQMSSKSSVKFEIAVVANAKGYISQLSLLECYVFVYLIIIFSYYLIQLYGKKFGLFYLPPDIFQRVDQFPAQSKLSIICFQWINESRLKTDLRYSRQLWRQLWVECWVLKDS